MNRYNPKEIEPKWQKVWDDKQTYKADLSSSKPKYMAMSMFNYPSGDGIHIGHAMTYTISDVMARFKRQNGYESYHPVGWDAFGLPAENYAIKSGVSPQQSMAQIIPSYHKQYKSMGWSNDWSKEISTHLPEYYKWSQWLFSQMYKNDLAYQDTRLQWWCDQCQTVLANEQVEPNGKCWRHDGPNDPVVSQKEVKQWFFKITEYAEELLEATDQLNWTDSVKLAQKNWIGKSVGAEIDFNIDNQSKKLTVFTTRPDTIFGATFLVLAPEHSMTSQLTTETQKTQVDKYLAEVSQKTEVERQSDKQKTGVFSGSYAINPANGQKIPIWIAEYVMSGYGTGAIMAVPAHDERDHQFATSFDLPIVNVIEPTFGEAHDNEQHKVGVNVILRNPQNNEIIILDWGPRKKDHGGKMLIGGGVEEGEDIFECAKREIAEETGYIDVKFIEKSAAIGRGHFYSNVKDKHFSIDAHGLLFDLVSDKRQEINLDEGEKNKFNVTWTPAEEGVAQLDDGIHRYFGETLALGRQYEGEGILTNSKNYSGLSTFSAREQIVEDLSKKSLVKEKTNYKIRDWSVSRQRYWGAPIPIVYCDECGPVLVEDKDLPVILPELDDFEPSGDGQSALARATDWVKVKCPKCGKEGKRETDTLDTYICSSWYMLRYLDPHNDQQIFNNETLNKWLPIDFYNGADHATAHLIYARFVNRFFYKIGLVAEPEPFSKMLFNGKITASDGTNFSKSKGNGVDPLEIIGQGYGADALRTYLMFAAPLELWVRWDPQGVPGTYRFLNRVWNICLEFSEAKTSDDKPNDYLQKITHQTIKKVTGDIENQKYNTAIAAMMKLTNDLYLEKAKNGFLSAKHWHFALKSLVALIAPFAPHTSEELWQVLGQNYSVQIDSWPKWDEDLAVEQAQTIIIQINGKLKGQISLPQDIDEAEVVEQAKKMADKHLANQKIKKHIYVKNKIINFVV